MSVADVTTPDDHACRILIVDDDQDFTEALQELLEARGFIVDTGHNMQQALETELGFRPDVALIDIRLGGNSGIDLVTILKRRRPGLVAIMITANADLDSAVEALRVGADDYLRKPFSPAELFATIETSQRKLHLVQAKSEAELALRESEERFRDMTASVPGVVYQFKIDADGKVSFPYVSPSIKNALGLEAARVVEDPDIWFDIIHADDRADLDASIQESHRTLEPWLWEGRVILPSKEVGWFRGSSIPKRLEDGSVLWSGLILDITEYKQAEEQLRQSQKMEAVGQLTGGVAHDFNNLLAIILGNAELLEDDLPAEKAVRLKPMIRAAKRGAELTDRLLAFSRRQALRPRPIELGELLEGLYSLLSRSLGATIEIETTASPELCTVTADPGQLENAILNLALNARDAMPEGGKLTIDWANAELDQDFVARNPGATAGDYVGLAVSDTGTGMSEQAMEHAFEPFFTTKPVGQGTGLGLSMVYGFAKQSGGYVTLDSEQGTGTTVTLYLPRADIVADRTKRNGAGPLPTGSGEVVLVLEDDADVRNLVVRILGGLDYRVIDVPDAHAAQAVLADEKVDLLLSDVVLPGGISGPELARIAKARNPALRVVFMSGYAAAGTNFEGFSDSETILLNKPFLTRELAEKVRAEFDR